MIFYITSVLDCSFVVYLQSLESETSSKSAEEHSVRADSLISLLQLVNTEDDNISYPAAVYRLASRCLQVER